MASPAADVKNCIRPGFCFSRIPYQDTHLSLNMQPKNSPSPDTNSKLLHQKQVNYYTMWNTSTTNLNCYFGYFHKYNGKTKLLLSNSYRYNVYRQGLLYKHTYHFSVKVITNIEF